jgi:hypothetical protein
MFTQSCSDVKAVCLALQHFDVDLSFNKVDRFASRWLRIGGEDKMFDIIRRLGAQRLSASNENVPNCLTRAEAAASASNMRALATGAALATSVDTSPAVLVSIYDYAHRYRDKGRRTA